MSGLGQTDSGARSWLQWVFLVIGVAGILLSLVFVIVNRPSWEMILILAVGVGFLASAWFIGQSTDTLRAHSSLISGVGTGLITGLIVAYILFSYQEEHSWRATVEAASSIHGFSPADHSFRDIQFSGKDLTDAELKGDDLSGMNFRDSILINARMIKAKLQNTTLVRANLGGAFLNDAKLSGADVTSANLSMAVLATVGSVRQAMANTATTWPCWWFNISPTRTGSEGYPNYGDTKATHQITVASRANDDTIGRGTEVCDLENETLRVEENWFAPAELMAPRPRSSLADANSPKGAYTMALTPSNFSQPSLWHMVNRSVPNLNIVPNYEHCVGGDDLTANPAAGQSPVFASDGQLPTGATEQKAQLWEASSETAVYTGAGAQSDSGTGPPPPGSARYALGLMKRSDAAGCLESALRRAAVLSLPQTAQGQQGGSPAAQPQQGGSPGVTLSSNPVLPSPPPPGSPPNISVSSIPPEAVGISPDRGAVFHVSMTPTADRGGGSGTLAYIWDGQKTVTEVDTLGLLGGTFPTPDQVNLICGAARSSNAIAPNYQCPQLP